MYHYLWRIVFLLSIIGGALGHAALVTPKPWWWAASRERPCGGANYTANPRAIWPVGSNQSITWWVIAGDGMGQVHARLNLNGDTNFSTNATIQWSFTQPVIDKLGYFKLSAVVPNVQCRGPNNTCTLQFFTDSGGGWYSCTTIAITCTGCTGGIPVSRDDCVATDDLGFCDNKDGTDVLVPDGQTAAQIDELTKYTFNLNYKNPNVFQNGNTTACMTLYKEMLCELYLSPCNSSQSNYTKQMCESALSTCGLTTNHSSIYNCSVFKDVPITTTTTTTFKSTTTTLKSTTTSKPTTTSGTTTTSKGTSSTTATKSTTTTAPSTTGKSARSFNEREAKDEVALDYEYSPATKLQVMTWLGLVLQTIIMFACL